MAAIARPNGPVITEESRFSEAWPVVAAEVVAWLRRKGVETEAAEDAVQEAGLRALVRQVRYEDPDDLRRWVRTVSWRIAVDGWRKDSRCDPVADVVELGAPPDEVVSSRLELEAALAAFGRLSSDERRAIVEPTEGLDRQARVRDAVRRHRARLRLVALMEGAAAVLAFAFRRGRTAAGATTVAFAATVAFVLYPSAGGPVPTTPSIRGAIPEFHVAERPATAATVVADPPAGIVARDGRTSGSGGARSAEGGRAVDAPEDAMLAGDLPWVDDSTHETWLDRKTPDEPILCARVVPVGTSVCTPPTPAPPDPRDLVEAPAL